MTIARLPSGRYRVRVWRDGKDVAAAPILGLPDGYTWEKKRGPGGAIEAEAKAREILRGNAAAAVTVADFHRRWTTDPLFARPKASTNRHNAERTRAFAKKYGSLSISAIGPREVDEWTMGGRNLGTIPALRAMWNDALRLEYVTRNPFAKRGFAKTRGNRDVRPPSHDTVWKLIRAARKQAGPSLAAWLQVAAFTGMRPGELDALRWENVDFDRSRISVIEQYNPVGGFTLPKNGLTRDAPLTPPAREALLALARESEFCFTSLRGGHWTPSSRAYHWKAVRAAVGYEGTLYLATRHHAGSYMTNELLLPSEDVAIALGHEDGGQLVRMLYGHRDKTMALDRVLAAYDRKASNVRPLRAVADD